MTGCSTHHCNSPPGGSAAAQAKTHHGLWLVRVKSLPLTTATTSSASYYRAVESRQEACASPAAARICNHLPLADPMDCSGRTICAVANPDSYRAGRQLLPRPRASRADVEPSDSPTLSRPRSLRIEFGKETCCTVHWGSYRHKLIAAHCYASVNRPPLSNDEIDLIQPSGPGEKRHDDRCRPRTICPCESEECTCYDYSALWPVTC